MHDSLPSDPRALEARIAGLETRLSRTRRALAAALLVGLVGGVAAAKAPPRPVVGSAFVLVDEAGKTRGQLALAEDGTASFILQSPSGAGDAGFLVSPSGASALRLRSPKRSVVLEAADDGRAELRVLQTHAKTAVAVGIDPAGRPQVVLNDKAGKVVFDSKQR